MFGNSVYQIGKALSSRDRRAQERRPCPACSAKLGESCITKGGKPCAPHEGRKRVGEH